MKPRLIEGGGGVFDVVVDGERIWCKQETGSFPEDDAIVAMLRERGD